MGNLVILKFFDHQFRSQLLDPSGAVLRPEHKASFGMATSAESGARHTPPMLITATHQSKEQEQGREDEGCERIGHHGGGPLLRLSEQVLPREDTPEAFRTCPSPQSRPCTRAPTASLTIQRQCLQGLKPPDKWPLGLLSLLNAGL